MLIIRQMICRVNWTWITCILLLLLMLFYYFMFNVNQSVSSGCMCPQCQSLFPAESKSFRTSTALWRAKLLTAQEGKIQIPILPLVPQLTSPQICHLYRKIGALLQMAAFYKIHSPHQGIYIFFLLQVLFRFGFQSIIILIVNQCHFNLKTKYFRVSLINSASSLV